VLPHPLYAIVDVETSGSSPRNGKITEIAIYLFDGEKVIDSFSSLLNPQIHIPYHIVQITGITNEMVQNAPKFYEVAKRIVEITKDAVFVAHNVQFDYGFIQQEFRSLGYTFSRKRLCTIRLAKKIAPESPAFGLSTLARYFQIENEARHRAWGDAKATVELFKRLIDKASDDIGEIIEQEIRDIKLPENLSREKVEQLPDDTGIYYFHNKKGDVLYVGKSKNIRTRVLSHFSNKGKFAISVSRRSQVHDISYTLTGSELMALLLENEEIKQLQPPFNRAQRRRRFSHGIYAEPNENGYLQLLIKAFSKKNRPIVSFTQRTSAEKSLRRRIREFNLCSKLSKLEPGEPPCYHHFSNLCKKGVCKQETAAEEYNERVQQAIHAWTYGKPNFFVIGKGRGKEEKSIVYIENGMYMGRGYFSSADTPNTVESLKEQIKPKAETPDTRYIIRRYIRDNPKEIVLI